MYRSRRGDSYMAGAQILIGFLVVLIYARTTMTGYDLSDALTVRDNPAIRHLTNWPYFFSRPQTATVANAAVYRPLATSYFAVEYALLGDAHPARWHLVSIALFLLVIGAAFAAAKSYLHDNATILLAVGLFATHPLSSGAVASISAQPVLLSAALIILGLAAFELGATVSEAARPAWLAGSLVLLVSAPFMHESGAVAPLLLALRLPPERPRYRRFAMAVTAAASVLFLVLRATLIADSGRGHGFVLDPDWLSRIGRWLGALVAPHTLYRIGSAAPPRGWETALGAFILVALPVFAWRDRFQRPDRSRALWFTWLTAWPWLGFSAGQTASASPPVLTVLGATIVLADLCRPLLDERRVNIFAPLLLAVVCALAMATFARMGVSP